MPSSLTSRLFGPNTSLVHGAWLCVLSALALSVLGIYAIDLGSSSGGGEHLSARAMTQSIYLAVGLLAGLIVALPNPQTVRLLAWPALAGCVVLLVFLLLPFVPSSIVRPRNGCRGWIDLGFFDLQPSELAKIAFVLVLAEYLRYSKRHRTWGGLVPPALVTAVPVALIMLQPDLGMALLFLPGCFAVLLAAGAKLKHLSIVVLAGALAGPAMYPFLKPYQQQRIVSLIKQIRGDASAASDPDLFQSATALMLSGAGQGSGYNEAQARAVVRFSRLPERHNDMIFAVIAARFGLLGGLAVLGLYATWLLGAILAAAGTRDPFGRLLIAGFAAMVAAQVVINVGMNVGIVPIVGITLPFVSYGGSSMIAVWIMTGLIFGVATRRAPRLSRPTFEFGDNQ